MMSQSKHAIRFVAWGCNTIGFEKHANHNDITWSLRICNICSWFTQVFCLDVIALDVIALGHSLTSFVQKKFYQIFMCFWPGGAVKKTLTSVRLCCSLSWAGRLPVPSRLNTLSWIIHFWLTFLWRWKVKAFLTVFKLASIEEANSVTKGKRKKKVQG